MTLDEMKAKRDSLQQDHTALYAQIAARTATARKLNAANNEAMERGKTLRDELANLRGDIETEEIRVAIETDAERVRLADEAEKTALAKV